MLTLKQRYRAIFHCLYFSILPYWVYEKKCHYSSGKDLGKDYLSHLWMNILTAKSLLFHTEHECTHNFHKAKVKYFRWNYK